MKEERLVMCCPPLKQMGEMAEESQIQITVALPDGYEADEKRYPVCYVMDGSSTVSRTKDSVGLHELYRRIPDLLPKVIFVGIDPPGKEEIRTSAYGPPMDTDLFMDDVSRAESFHLEGCGDRFSQWIEEMVMPKIDAVYRTIPDGKNTAIIGFSSGGTFAILTGILYPDKFTRVGCFSPSTWIWSGWFYAVLANLNREYEYRLADQTQHKFRASVKHLSHLYFYQGGEDGSSCNPQWALSEVENLYHLLRKSGAGYESHRFDFCEEGTHTARYWKEHLAVALRSLFTENDSYL